MKRKLLCRELLFVNKRASSLSEMVSLKNQGHKYLDNWCTWKNGNDLFVLPSCYTCVEKRNPDKMPFQVTVQLAWLFYVCINFA